jgi:hypothetical protein
MDMLAAAFRRFLLMSLSKLLIPEAPISFRAKSRQPGSIHSLKERGVPL